MTKFQQKKGETQKPKCKTCGTEIVWVMNGNLNKMVGRCFCKK